MQPQGWLIDFEAGMIAALPRVYPGLPVWGCYFHFCQAIQAWLQRNGLKETYERDMDFAIIIQQFKALAFVPIHLVQQYFDLLVASIHRDHPQYAQMLAGFVDYIQVENPLSSLLSPLSYLLLLSLSSLSSLP